MGPLKDLATSTVDAAFEQDRLLGVQILAWNESDGDRPVDDVERALALRIPRGVGVFATEPGVRIILEERDRHPNCEDIRLIGY